MYLERDSYFEKSFLFELFIYIYNIYINNFVQKINADYQRFT